MLTYILFAAGFVLLIKGADWLVDGASAVARKMNISEMTIGLTIVSIGTSAPELIVNVIASINGNADIAIGNVFGSNIANVLLILGVTAIVYPMSIRRNTIRTDIPFLLVATLLVGFLANAHIFTYSESLFISRFDGILLIVFFLIFLSYVFKMSGNSHEKADANLNISMPKASLFILAGIICLFLGGKWVVEGAVVLAKLLGLSESFIGLTIVAVGTSLPELVTSVIAARKKNADIAVGNVLGSNVFNLLWILGLSALIEPLAFSWESNFDILVMLGSSVLILLIITLNKRFQISRKAGIIFTMLYAAYIVYLLLRDSNL